MIAEVTELLRGRVGTLIATLQIRMDKASEALCFEEAAELRDKIDQLSVYNERQKIIDPELVDRDIFAIARDATDACGVVFIVREGKIIERKHHYMSGIAGKTDNELLEIFVNRYYLEAQDIPAEIYLSCTIEKTAPIKQWLSGRKESTVSVIVPKIGEKAKLVGLCNANAQLLLDELRIQKLNRKGRISKGLLALQKDLRLLGLPRRIECFDISHLHGTDTVASMVVFIDGKPRKSEYRKFKLKTVEGIDDYAGMREVIRRRYERVTKENILLPDLIVVDGGKGQLGSAVDVLKDLGIISVVADESLQNKQVIIGLAKRLEEVYLPDMDQPLTIPKASPGLRILQHIRNEAHRFAIQYQRSLRSKHTIRTELDLIKGIGKVRSRNLLEFFGSIHGVRQATEAQLVEVIGAKIAKIIRKYFEK